MDTEKPTQEHLKALVHTWLSRSNCALSESRGRGAAPIDALVARTRAKVYAACADELGYLLSRAQEGRLL